MVELRTLMFLSLVLVAVACGSAASAPGGGDETLPVVRLRPEPASFTYYSGLTQPQQLVIRDQTAWRQVWESIWRGHSPQPPLPDIDFGRDMVIVAALGARNTGGYSVFIDSASAGPSGVTLRIRSVSPGTACITTQAVTQPVDIARLPRREGPVIFAERQEIQDCR